MKKLIICAIIAMASITAFPDFINASPNFS